MATGNNIGNFYEKGFVNAVKASINISLTDENITFFFDNICGARTFCRQANSALLKKHFSGVCPIIFDDGLNKNNLVTVPLKAWNFILTLFSNNELNEFFYHSYSKALIKLSKSILNCKKLKLYENYLIDGIERALANDNAEMLSAILNSGYVALTETLISTYIKARNENDKFDFKSVNLLHNFIEANINSKNGNGCAIIHELARECHHEYLDFLLNNFGNININDMTSTGATAFTLAVDSNEKTDLKIKTVLCLMNYPEFELNDKDAEKFIVFEKEYALIKSYFASISNTGISRFFLSIKVNHKQIAGTIDFEKCGYQPFYGI